MLSDQDENKTEEGMSVLPDIVLYLLSWCALKGGFVPLEDSNPLKCYQHVVIVPPPSPIPPPRLYGCYSTYGGQLHDC